MNGRTKGSLAAIGVAMAALATAPAALADTIRVDRGESIQAAIDAASPGDTIRVAAGRFRENVNISKDDITLVGAGMRAGGTMLLPPAEAAANNCSEPPEFVSGICISGTFGPGEPTPVTGTTVRGFWVNGFPGFGVFLLVADDTTVTRTQATNNHGYGISGFVLSGVRFTHNRAHANGEPGFYIGDSPHANAVVAHNQATANVETGYLFRDASIGRVHHNRSAHNCAGMIFVDTGSPGDTARWRVRHNLVRVNNKDCLDAELAFSGHGVVLGGTSRVLLANNVITGNQPAGPGALLPSGGVVMVSTAGFGGDAPRHNVIRHNTILRNRPHDVFWDRSGTGNVFAGNDCRTSSPRFICRR
jgi:hypothetical protein